MISAKRSLYRLSVFVITFVGLIALGIAISGQEAPKRGLSMIEDWSNHHVVFTNPGSAVAALAGGRLREWYRTINEPRYILQQMKRTAGVRVLDTAGSTAESMTLLPDISTQGGRRGSRGKFATDWSEGMGTGANVGAGQYPAKFSFSNTTASCNDYVVYNTGTTGSTTTQPTIVAYNNIYSGCATIPTVYWQYNTAYEANPNEGTSDTSTITTSVALVGPVGVTTPTVAFVQNAGSQASLVLLKYSSNASVVAMDSSTNNVGPSGFYDCTLPCMTRISFGSTSSTNSPPFYDYLNDVLYVGDDAGVLHKFQYIYSNTNSNVPGEITGGGTSSGWPQTMSSGNKLTGPILDVASGNVFVGTSAGTLVRIPSTGGSSNIVTSGALSHSGGTGIVDAPLIDSTSSGNFVYVFVGYVETQTSPSAAYSSEVYQFATNFGVGTSGTSLALNENHSGATTTIQYDGAFDNIHYVGGGTTGNMYVCTYHSTGTEPNLYEIAFPFSSTSTTNSIEEFTSAAATCSPVTEFLGGSTTTTTLTSSMTSSTTTADVSSSTSFTSGDYVQVDSEIMLITGKGTGTLAVTRGELGTTAAAHANTATVMELQDWIYLSVTANGSDAACTGSCLYNWNVTTTLTTGGATAGMVSDGGASGVIVDNSVTSGTESGADQIYFSTLASGSTTLSSTITAAATSVPVASGTNLINGSYILIDSEVMLISSGGGSTSLTVTRGQDGTTAVGHTSGVAVKTVCFTSKTTGGCAVQASQSAP